MPASVSAPMNASAPVRRSRGRPRKTAAERDDGNRRRALLKGAARLFKRKGFAGATTRDIAAAAGMRSGSPFYYFESKQALLFAVMHEGMLGSLQRQDAAVSRLELDSHAAATLRALVRNHFDSLLGPGSDFIPVMLFEFRSLLPSQRRVLARLQQSYEAAWVPVLQALHAQGRLRAEVRIARLLIFGALNWAVQWYDRRGAASLDRLTDEAVALFVGEEIS